MTIYSTVDYLRAEGEKIGSARGYAGDELTRYVHM